MHVGLLTFTSSLPVTHTRAHSHARTCSLPADSLKLINKPPLSFSFSLSCSHTKHAQEHSLCILASSHKCQLRDIGPYTHARIPTSPTRVRTNFLLSHPAKYTLIISFTSLSLFIFLSFSSSLTTKRNLPFYSGAELLAQEREKDGWNVEDAKK